MALTANTSWYLYNFRRNTITAFISQGYTVYALAPEDAFSEKLTRLGCHYFCIPIRGTGKNPLYEAYTLFLFLRAYRAIKPDMVFQFTIKCNLYGSMAALLLGTPYVNNISGLGSAFNSKGPVNRLIRALYKATQNGAKRIFFQNQSDFDFMTGQGLIEPGLAEILPGSGVDLIHFQPHVKTGPEAFTFVFAGRILWEKGFPFLIDAMRKLKQRGIPAKCLVFGLTHPGDGKYVPEDRLLAWEKEGLITYGKHAEDVREAYVLADCVVLPSFYREGVPRGLLEAAAMAKPIIATDWIGCREVVKHGVNGFLCDIKDADSLADAMERILRLDGAALRAMGEAGRKIVENSFSENVVIERYLAMAGPTPLESGGVK